ncbi:hypothetical protein CGMCC3_g17900 [Colletotrichum fructicola]|nr:uncharacterized protein CGMCC3_g17900 [Colletotrichum fructicola]KAE9565920.1 hypothetical protein CGMCC3_g17900 [Colletotrichum fructicola]KAF4881093.1 hypothetical protein CGCFRS4_v015901 [Colletotrichum fructicola]
MSPPSDSIVDDGLESQYTARSTRSLSSFDFDETEATDSDDSLGQQRRKLPPHKTFRPVDSDVVVSVTERSQRDLVKRFNELNIDWTMVESQLQEWSHLTRAGKKLRIDVSFNFVVSRQETTSAGRTKRGRRSVTDQMLSDRALQIDAEESSTSLAPV